jgi:hypothetical protein
MNQVLRLLAKVGVYVYRNSIWLIPVIETTYRQIVKIIKRKKDE